MAGLDDLVDNEFSMADCYELGTQMTLIGRAAKLGQVAYAEDEDALDIVSLLNRALANIEKSDVGFNIYEEMDQRRRKIMETYSDEDGQPTGEEISDEDGEDLNREIQSWSRLIHRKLEDIDRLSIPDRGLIDAKTVIDDPSTLFSNQNVWNSLSPQIREDLHEASKAVTFGLPTASVVMSFRAVESRVYDWYTDRTERDVEDRTFGAVISEIEDTFEDEEEPAIISHLWYISEMRNQIAHPERTPDLQEAESTLIMSREVIRDLHNRLSE